MKYLVILTKSRFVAEQLVKSFIGIGNGEVKYTESADVEPYRLVIA